MALYRSGWRAQHHRNRKLPHQQRRSVTHGRPLRPGHRTAACGDHRRRYPGGEPDPALAGIPDKRGGHPGGLSVQPTSLGEGAHLHRFSDPAPAGGSQLGRISFDCGREGRADTIAVSASRIETQRMRPRFTAERMRTSHTIALQENVMTKWHWMSLIVGATAALTACAGGDI